MPRHDHSLNVLTPALFRAGMFHPRQNTARKTGTHPGGKPPPFLDPYKTKEEDINRGEKEREAAYRRDACRFYGRCFDADETCRREKEPEL
ncbi:MAG: hypothetical protein LBV07_03070, partial [Syntrophobacterales bacterium]|nr:hypothetical protein [Syntrophobacterales bacterium]